MSGILITGGTGLLGPYIKEACLTIGPAVVTGRTRGDRSCDLADPTEAGALIEEVRPGIVFHCAAMTDVDACERNPGRAWTVNCGTVTNLAARLPPQTKLVYISTDQVYPDTAGPHTEDRTGPVNRYGATKLKGEAVTLARAGGLVLRVNFFGPSRTPGRESLSDWLIGNLHARKPITLFTDSLFSPLHLETLARTAVEAVTHELAGVFNVGCRDGASKCDFALEVASHLGFGTDRAMPSPSTKIAGRARRTKDLRMDVSRIERALQRRMPTMQQEVARL